MAGASVTIDDKALRAMLRGLELATGDHTDLFGMLGAQIEMQTQRRFETGTGPDGKPWQKSRRAIKRGGQTLTDTARLRQSITRQVSPTEASVGTNVVYAAIHQFGGTIKREGGTVTLYRNYDARTDTFDHLFRKQSRSNFATDHKVGPYQIKMPARPFLGVGAADVPVLQEIARDWLAEAGGLS